ncbi:bifunctional phosphopantothenoylcysteine decarboxylase/phosphopantothenate--cysteine ligase CoaBC [uncultured Alistipes sp.]|uniref:bifunctional phosphopantothenoylcysteine decarboxylase/phosphopantothenate--cysteine ligase CoaBC n=1 Tax=uncultured Alistipes sp. TaxID=538949 RepID=UPI0026277A5A|nr:bifunctional phosphopantothenoylcysteine decarboxylase/phosphopantothenate--cysteine ligase CoaBC [uncultured Alistipes sp.]
MLQGKHILLGVTGSIAAYKAAVLCRLLRTAGAEVQVVMTALAKEFITPLTMATLSKRPILVEFFDPENGAWNSHVSLGEWADLMLVAPATANTLSKMAHGTADNLLLTTYLSARCPVAVAPAMDLDMYAHVATQQNLRTLAERGVTIIEPGEGELASGLTGKGRMEEPEAIVRAVERLLAAGERRPTLAGKRYLVTAGATIEPIDPVRYLTNHSTGKMGYAIAGELAARGADVTLVSGRTALAVPQGVRRIEVLTAEEMYRAATEAFDAADGAVMCAAVADYTPEQVAERKMEKGDGSLTLRLRRTKDIAAELGARKGGRLLVGFALETHDEEAHAEAKLERKNFDFVVLNSLRDAGAGFRGDTNKVTFIDRTGREALPLLSKSETAARIVDKIESLSK